MHVDLGFLAFAALIGAQFLAVVLVNSGAPRHRTTHRPGKRKEVRTWNTLRLA
jgi:hypothetical protein